MLKAFKSKESGATLLEVIFLTSAVALATVLSMQAAKMESDSAQARMAGTYLSQYNNAVRSYVARNIGTNGDFSGTDWLKSTSCGGGSAVAYLPCDFPSMTAGVPFYRGQMVVATHIRSVSKPITSETRAITIVSPFKLAGKARSDLSGTAALVVASTKANSKDITSTDGKVYSDPKTGEITMEASNVAGGDAWLRVDGGNQMMASLKFDNTSELLRNVVGVSAVESFAGELIHLGPISAILPSITEGVVVGMNTNVLGRLQARDQIISGADVNVLSGDLTALSGTIAAKSLKSTDKPTLKIDPNGLSSTKGVTLDGKLIINNQLHPGTQMDQACDTLGAISSDTTGRIMTCIANKWTRVSKSPKIYRFPFYVDQDWVVPDGVLSAYVSMAGGGSSGLGWRSSNYTAAGHSGGFVLNHPLNLIPGETLRVQIGKGGEGYGPKVTGVLADPGPPYYIFMNSDAATHDGLSGYPGSSSIVSSLTRGTQLIECSGGSGAVMNGYSAMASTPLMPGALFGSPEYGVVKDYAPALYPSPTRPATGANAIAAGPGACGAAEYGRGQYGESIYEVTSGSKLGGLSPLGYGSGGGVYASGCYVTHNRVGTCVNADAGKDGVVYIDVLY